MAGGKDTWTRSDVIALGILFGTVAAVAIALWQLNNGPGYPPSRPEVVTIAQAAARANRTVVSDTHVTSLQQTVQDALVAHYAKIEKGEYESAWRDLTGHAEKAAGPEKYWISKQKQNRPHGFVLSASVRSLGGRAAEAKIAQLRTFERGNAWCFRGSMRLVETSTGWAIDEDGLSPRVPC